MKLVQHYDSIGWKVHELAQNLHEFEFASRNTQTIRAARGHFSLVFGKNHVVAYISTTYFTMTGVWLYYISFCQVPFLNHNITKQCVFVHVSPENITMGCRNYAYLLLNNVVITITTATILRSLPHGGVVFFSCSGNCLPIVNKNVPPHVQQIDYCELHNRLVLYHHF